MKMLLRLPSLDLLDLGEQGGAPIDREHLEHRALALEAALRAFGIEGFIVQVHVGPLFTAFYVELPPGARAARLRSLGPDLARTLGVREVLIEMMTGRPEPAIMISNDMRQEISLGELIASQAFAEAPGSLPFLLGKALNGDPACFDLSSMHHLLVAGPTGSGKSVIMHAILLSLLYRFVPNQLRLVLVDLKGVELGLYDQIPHLLAPVATEVHQAVGVLRWLVEQMDKRLRLMADARSRNLADFNAKAAGIREARAGEAADNCSSEQAEVAPLPRIVVAIDELGGLMTCAFADVDPLLQRLVSRGHLAGIHVLLSTERPSSDVVSGGVKANLPSRLAFRVFSSLESRIILDENGAENLHGNGDMLMKALGHGVLRIHGPNVAQAEIQAVVEHWREQSSPDYMVEEGIDGAPNFPPPAVSSMYDRAVELVLEDCRASASGLQRRLGISYTSAAALIDEMERRGIVGPPNYVGRREVYDPSCAKPSEQSHQQEEPRPSLRWPWVR